jgi:hypothetical protein
MRDIFKILSFLLLLGCQGDLLEDLINTKYEYVYEQELITDCQTINDEFLTIPI